MKRKTNRAKRVVNSCRNHGSCPQCKGNRTHANIRRRPADEKEQVSKWETKALSGA